MDTQKQKEQNSSKPTVVLVHGAVEDSSLWTHGVIQGLQRGGFPVKLFSNPLRGLLVDAAGKPFETIVCGFSDTGHRRTRIEEGLDLGVVPGLGNDSPAIGM